MTSRSTDSSVTELLLRRFRPDAASVPNVRVFEDSSGGSWVRIYSPLDADTVNELRSMHDAGEIQLQTERMPDEDFRASEMAWLHENHTKLSGLYPGEWLAVDGPQLVAHAYDLATLLRLAQEAGHPNPFVTAIPAEPVVSLHL